MLSYYNFITSGLTHLVFTTSTIREHATNFKFSVIIYIINKCSVVNGNDPMTLVNYLLNVVALRLAVLSRLLNYLIILQFYNISHIIGGGFGHDGQA